MKIEKNKMVSVIYELRENDSNGKIIEALDETRPLNFIFGAGRLLPEFESNIGVLNNGDSFRFAMDSKSAYGEKREDMIINIPKDIFLEDGIFNEEVYSVGKEVQMVDPSGNPLNGIINEISDSFVLMDFNHPMAGVNLFFSGKVIDVRDATEEELAALNHSCSCSSCGSSCESECSGSCS
jgi:FKBP-type peptidyl-prolyl cis-trans isomerase SlyD